MQALILLIQKLLTDPKVEAILVLGLGQLLQKKFMQASVEEKIKKTQPLFLPRGSVRAILTIMLCAIISGSFVWRYELPPEFYAMALLAIGYYVGYRADNTQTPEIKS